MCLLLCITLIISHNSTLSFPTIISGDFNIHIDTSSSDSICFKSLSDICNIIWCNIFKCNNCLSDHFCITSQLDMFELPLYRDEVISFRKYNKIDMDKIITIYIHETLILLNHLLPTLMICIVNTTIVCLSFWKNMSLT